MSATNTSVKSPSISTSKPAMSYGLELPSWLPEDKKQDITNLQIKTFNSPKGRIRRPRIRKRDPGHVPRPMNSFLSYRTEQQLFIRKYCPGANHREISKIVAKWWHDLDENGKGLYRELANSAKEKHAERYPDYKFTPKKKKSRTLTAADPTYKDLKCKKILKEEILYTNIHDADYPNTIKEPSPCQHVNNQAPIDPTIAAAAAAVGMAAQGGGIVNSYQNYYMNIYPGIDEKSLKLLDPYQFQESVLFPNGAPMPAYVNMDPPLYPQCEVQNNNNQPEQTQYTPALEYSDSPAEACLSSPSIPYPSNFALADAYNYTDNQDILWNY